MAQEPPPDGEVLCGVKEIAKHLGRTERQATHWVRLKLIPTFKIGGAVCSTRTMLAEHFAAQREP